METGGKIIGDAVDTGKISVWKDKKMNELIKSRINELIETEDTVMSNIDHEINYEVAELLKDGKHYAQYSGWDFCGYVYYNTITKKFICEVWVYGTCREIVEYKTLKLIMKNVCENYGYN